MKIRTKLLITFLSAILLPLIITLSLFSIYLSYKTRDKEFNRADINESATELTMRISQYFTLEDGYDSLDLSLKNELAPYSSIIEYIEVTDLNGKIIYNSSDSSKVGRIIDLRKLASYSNDPFNFNYEKRDGDFYLKLIKPLIVGDSASGFILFKQNPYTLIEYVKKIAYPIVWFGVGSIMLVIVFFSWLISRGIIIPLKELSSATEQISMGNLDFEIKYKKGDELGTLCTAFETMRDKLKDSLGKQVEYENSRKELIASISHDLRTPLTSIKGYVEGLRDGIIKDPQKFQKYLEVIYNKTVSMNKLIDDLFEYSSLDLGSIKINKKKIECRSMLQKIGDNLKYDIEKDDIIFSISIGFHDFFILADVLRIEQVINNLISNTLRYTRTIIELKAFIKDDNLIVSVRDDGCGIKDDEKTRVFERFYRGEKSRSAKGGGTGLGLAIAKKIIEEHSGSIWAESVGGEGTSLYFSIPGTN